MKWKYVHVQENIHKLINGKTIYCNNCPMHRHRYRYYRYDDFDFTYYDYNGNELKLNLNIEPEPSINQTFVKIGNMFDESGLYSAKSIKIINNKHRRRDLWIWDTTNAAKFKIN